MEEINKEYQRLCTILGDVEVKLKGFNNQKAQLFKQLAELDKQAAEVIKKQEESKNKDKGARPVAENLEETSETKGI